MRKIALIGCSKTKENKNCPETKYVVKELFTGKNYIKARDEGIERFGCEENFYVLSSKYHLLSCNATIPYYDIDLYHFSENEKEKWADKVIEQLKEKFDLTKTEFVIFAGNNYSKYIKKHLNCTILKFNGRHITFEVKEQLKNGGK